MTMTFQRPVLNRHACGAGSEDPNPDSGSGILQLAPHELAVVHAGVLPAIVPFVLANPGFAAGVVGGGAFMSRALRKLR